MMKSGILLFLFLSLAAPVWAQEEDRPPDGALDPTEVLGLLDRLWRHQYRLVDLLNQVEGEIGTETKEAVSSADPEASPLEQLEALERHRAGLERRPTNLYLALQTWENTERVMKGLARIETALGQGGKKSLAREFTQARTQLRGFEATLWSYVRYLVRSQDQVISAMEGNLANCQEQVGAARGNRLERARIVPNRRPRRPRLPQRRQSSSTPKETETSESESSTP